MDISAKVKNRKGHHEAMVTSGGQEQSIAIACHESGLGSGVNGGELLCLALATCYCNDVYREAKARGITIHEVEVEALAQFGEPGEPPVNVRYHVRVKADATDREIRALLMHTDEVSEIQNTLRQGVPVRLGHVDAVSV